MKVFPNDHGRFKDLSAAVQSIAVTVAVIIGGIWSLYTFSALGQVNRAQRELARIEEELKEEANLNFTTTIAPLAAPGMGDRYVSITVNVTNSGSRATRLDFTEGPLRVMAVKDSAEAITYKLTEQLWPLTYSRLPHRTKYRGSIVRPTGSQNYTFITRLPGPGLYWITFSVPTSQQELEISREAGSPAVDNLRTNITWSSGVFYVST